MDCAEFSILAVPGFDARRSTMSRRMLESNGAFQAGMNLRFEWFLDFAIRALNDQADCTTQHRTSDFGLRISDFVRP
jgi:hypothetical protein